MDGQHNLIWMNRSLYSNTAWELAGAAKSTQKSREDRFSGRKAFRLNGARRNAALRRKRIIFTLPDDAPATTLTLAQALGNDPFHAYTFDLSTTDK